MRVFSTSFTVKDDKFIIFFNDGVELVFPKELYTEYFEEWHIMHKWFDKCYIDKKLMHGDTSR